MIKAIIFDLFETLVTEANSVKMTSFKISEMLKVPYDEYKRLVLGYKPPHGFQVLQTPCEVLSVIDSYM